MYFKRLELLGFKSFADKTTLDFEAGVTAIVGPNGCGKSNISDAIRWVLGEQSAKSLRGSSMEDVIFNGSSAKEALNFTEVSLTLSNQTRILPIDYDEVTISRRLYRSGESEYLLNKNNVRLRDVHELLMGTGIGTESYSIIEQGKMDVILNSRPDERRVIFEEAAGITKFKSQKKEALRKLEQTDQNLLRVNDIIQEVKRQIGSIERQAKKAEAYKVEFEKLKNLELSIGYREFSLFENERQEKIRQAEELIFKETESDARAEELDRIYSDKKIGLDRLEGSLQENVSREMLASGQMRKDQDRILLNRERMGELVERRDNLLRQIESARKRVEEFMAEHSLLSAQFEEAAKEEAEGLLFLGTAETEFQAIDHFSKSAETESRALRQAQEDAASGKLKHRSELAQVRAQGASLAARIESLETQKAAIAREMAEADSVLGEANGALGAQDSGFWGRIRQFKEKIKELLSQFAGNIGTQEDARLEAEIKTFAEDILRFQESHADEREKRASIEGRRSKLDETLEFLAGEIAGLAGNRERFIQNEASLATESAGAEAQERSLRGSILNLEMSVRNKTGEREALLVRLAETRSRQGAYAARREKIEKDKSWILESKKTQEELSVSYEKEAQEAGSKKEALEIENQSLDADLSRVTLERDEILRQMESLRLEREDAALELETLHAEQQANHRSLDETRRKLHETQMEGAQVGFAIDRLKERIFNAYQIDLLVQGEIAQTQAEAQAALEGNGAPLNLEEAREQIQKHREKLNKMGPVNLVAIEEHSEMKARFEFLTQQEQDLIKAKEDLHKAILKINRTTRELFTETFAKVQQYFTEYFKLLFHGGMAELVLLDQEDVLESGIEIVARPPGKKLQTISLLSGGEKALTATALMFALFKVKPSPFCILDEIDAPLDETNVERFCNVLKEFIVGSQFILITHNKQTMNLADAMYGITMAQTGVSRVVSVKFSEKKQLQTTHSNGAGEATLVSSS